MLKRRVHTLINTFWWSGSELVNSGQVIGELGNGYFAKLKPMKYRMATEIILKFKHVSCNSKLLKSVCLGCSFIGYTIQTLRICKFEITHSITFEAKICDFEEFRRLFRQICQK